MALGLGFLLSACSGAPDEGTAASGETTIEHLSDGNVVVHQDGGGESESQDGAPAEYEGYDFGDKANCVYIQYCNKDGRIICRSRHCGCTFQQAADECGRDARAVCGNSFVMSSFICHSGF